MFQSEKLIDICLTSLEAREYQLYKTLLFAFSSEVIIPKFYCLCMQQRMSKSLEYTKMHLKALQTIFALLLKSLKILKTKIFDTFHLLFQSLDSTS